MANQELPKAYEPQKYESDIYKKWEDNDFFNPDILRKSAESFTISLPPPNATGTLHLGHATMLAIQDLIIRFHRLAGKKTLWLPGTDHAAIATQNVVEKKLYKEEGKTRFDYGRPELLKKIDEFVASSKSTIRQQMRAMGASCDWSRERYTLDEGLSRAVKEVFVRMYKDGLIYRGKRIVNWCTRCGTTLSDDEVEYKNSRNKFYYLKYGPIVIGTARPETKVLDKVIIVHPDDERYQKYLGKEFDVPWIDGTVRAKVVADQTAEKDLGTGAMTITPAHSFVDFELAQKYGFDIVDIIGPDGKMTKAAGKFAGLPVKEARKAIVEELQSKGLVEKIDEDYEHNLSICYRCGWAIEPMPQEQWFVAVDKEFTALDGQPTTLKKLALQAVASGQIEIIPERFGKIYSQWLNNLKDWCISRQIWFGHRVPVWYCGVQTGANKRMGWADDVVPQVKDGKTCTYRLRDHGFLVGDRVIFEDSFKHQVFGYGRITEINRARVKDLNLQDKRHYTLYDSTEQLIGVFKKRNSNKLVDEETAVWSYVYEFDSQLPDKDCGCRIISSVEPLVCPTCGGQELHQDPDTLDTWFSSGLWTFSTLLAKDHDKYKTWQEWLDNSPDLKNYHPTNLMETGYDILFFWVVRMVIMTKYSLNQIPFKKVYLHGLVRDKQGKKMSKSLGNGIDPLAMIDKYGADALRLSMIVGTTPGNDFRLYEEKIAGYRNFINKLWNISRYILMNLSKPQRVEDVPAAKTLADKWILSRLSRIITLVTEKLENYELSQAAESLYDFTWHELADWYLEVAKAEEDKEEIFNYLLTQLLKLWHPLAPFITEVLWQEAFGDKTDKMLIVQSWPQQLKKIDEEAEAAFKKIQDIVTVIRNYRAVNKMVSSQQLKIFVKQGELTKEAKLSIKNLRTKIDWFDNLDSYQEEIVVADIVLGVDITGNKD
ncbi:valine--tRNA ligase [Patescibacteria group bacterium]|nr:valine--tRNA ligase [Patescibacteria group bacterium]